MFSRTDRCGNSAYDWNTMEMRRLAGGNWVTSRSPMRMVPDVGVSSPAIMRSVVVLPQPDGPSSTVKLPAGTVKLTPWIAAAPPYCLVRLSRTMDDMLSLGSSFLIRLRRVR